MVHPTIPPVLEMAAAPTNGVNAVQTLSVTGSPDGGSFTLTFGGKTTTAIAFNAAASDVQTALQALSSIGAGNVICTGGPLPGANVTITFANSLAGQPQSTITHTDSLTGGTNPAASVTSATSGVWGSYRTALPGALLLDTANGFIYKNTGDQFTPVWTKQ